MSRYPQNTYVGMRYVPLFDGNWSETKNYEPLTVVNVEGNSYTSKTFVPAGVSPVGNPDYWAESGNYNAQIESYRAEVLKVSADVSELSEKQIETEQDVILLKKGVGNVVLIGDSYLDHFHGIAKDWGDYLRDYLGATYDVNLFRQSQSGCGFVQFAENKNFETLLSEVSARMTENQRSKTTHIIVCGGANDRSATTSNIRASISQFIKKASQLFSNATVYIGMVGATYDKSFNLGEKFSVENAYSRCGEYGGAYMPYGYECLSAKNDFYGDALHPSEAGSINIANFVLESAIKHVAYEKNAYMFGDIISQSIGGHVLTTLIKSFNKSFALSSSYTCDGRNALYTLDIADFLATTNRYYNYVTLRGYVKDDRMPAFALCDVDMVIESDGVKFYVTSANVETLGWITLSGNVTLLILDSSVYIPMRDI